MGDVQFFVHPYIITVVLGIGIFAILPIGAPSGIGTFYNMYQTFTFAPVVPIIVRANDITIFVKYKFVGIAESGREDFKITAIGIGSYNDSLIGVVIIFSICGSDIGPNIPYAPIDPSIGTFYGTRHPMSAKTDMYPVSMGDGGFVRHDPIPVLIR